MADAVVAGAKDGKAPPSSQWEFSCDLEVDFQSEENASMVHAALAVDKELQPDKVKRQMSLSDGKLSVLVFLLICGHSIMSLLRQTLFARTYRCSSARTHKQWSTPPSHFEAVEARFLRASFSAFVDILTLATKTIEEFGPRQEAIVT
ncbi:hypothetical protein AAC387_Pa12g1906 [Persea americana]